MDNPRYKYISVEGDSVQNLIDALKEIPSDFSLSLTGMNSYGIMLDMENKVILLDSPEFIDELMSEYEEQNAIDLD